MNTQVKREDIEAKLVRARHQYERAAAGAAHQEVGAKEKLGEARELVTHLEVELRDLDAAEMFLEEEESKGKLESIARERKNAVKNLGVILKKRKVAFLSIVRLITELGEQMCEFENTRNESLTALEPFHPDTREDFLRRIGNPIVIRNKLDSLMWTKGVRLRPTQFGANEVSNLDFAKFIDQLNENALRLVSEG